ncbi:NAD-dependent epimerase/dehydratase family protein [Ensifer sp. HO-A22]|uniref:NAD-dependent epimerase/dehydratase family protein n=1 Tax=Ensifer oleiphilus TaxID=2742698 RepID=A0A7Y6UN46_9HYPH|nr:NAD-dependent epimerase/dehydratase family protein [Ensifer oleiphilus]NVD39797.1 NAD-dependent epimerase/dehydratase family protein [Ensifer oleiphilus]
MTKGKSLRDRRCVVLGGGGFIGTHLSRRLAGKVGSLRAFGRSENRPRALSGIEWLGGDFNDPRSIRGALEGCDVVFHLINASTPSSANLDKIGDLKSNVVSTIQLLDACVAAGVQRVIFVSSGGTVYGVPQSLPTREDDACWPITSYGISKLAIERYLHLYEYIHGLEYRILRVSNPFGPHQTAERDQGVIGAFLRRIINEQPIELWGDGSVSRDYLYVDDVIDAFELAMLHEGRSRVFNIGSGVSRTLNEVIAALENVTGKKIDIVRKDGRLVDIPVSVLDISRARNELGWIPKTEFDAGLRSTFQWLIETQ